MLASLPASAKGQRLRRACASFLYAPSRPDAIGLLRLLLGFAMLKEWVDIAAAIPDLYGRHGFLQETLMLGLGGQGAALLSATLPDAAFGGFLHVFYLGRLVFLILFTLGIATRFSTLGLWLMQIYLMGSGEFSSYGLHRYFMVLLFLLLFMPAGESFTIGRALRPGPKPRARWEATFGLRVLQLAVLTTYLDAGLSKTAGVHWWNGDAVWRALHLPEFHRADFLWMAAVPLVPKLLAWGTMFLETFYIVGVWVPGLGIWWTLAIIAMHGGIAAYLGLVNFGLTMAAINSALFLHAPLRQALARRWPRSFAGGPPPLGGRRKQSFEA